MLQYDRQIRVIAIVSLLAAPAMTVRFLSSFYDLPHLLPLGLTEQNVAAARRNGYGDTSARINVTVDWGRDWSGAITQERLREVIAQTLSAQTKMYHIQFEDARGDRIDVTFAVGPNKYGPFSLGQMASGVQSALIALRMTNGPENR